MFETIIDNIEICVPEVYNTTPPTTEDIKDQTAKWILTSGYIIKNFLFKSRYNKETNIWIIEKDDKVGVVKLTIYKVSDKPTSGTLVCYKKEGYRFQGTMYDFEVKLKFFVYSR